MSDLFSIYLEGHDEMVACGQRIGRLCAGGEVMFLRGELGAGKTTLAQGIAMGLGVKDIVNSPTFMISKEYDTAKAGCFLVHVDLYRLRADSDLQSVGLQEAIHDQRSVTLVEWPERVSSLMLEPHIDIVIEGSGKSREVTFCIDGSGGTQQVFFDRIQHEFIAH